MPKQTKRDLPTIEQLEAELARIHRKKQKKHGYSTVRIPSIKQVATERARQENEKKSVKNMSEVPSQAPNEKKQIQSPSMEQVVAVREQLRYRSRFRKVLGSTIGILLVVAAVAALVTTLFLPVLQVSGSSMEPTLENGDIIVLRKTSSFDTGDLVGLYFNGKIMLKRVIGQAGDYVNIDSDGNVYVNGIYIDEPYVTGKSLGDCDITFPLQVPDSTCFVLGDHRSVSIDSRNSIIGCISTEHIIGKVVVRIWPLPKIEILQ